VLSLETEQSRGTLVPRSGKGRLIEIGRCYGIEMYVEKTRLKKISRKPSPLKTRVDKKKSGKCGVFQQLVSLIKMMQGVTVKKVHNFHGKSSIQQVKVRLMTLPPSCAVVMKSRNLNFLEPSGPLQAYNGTALPLPFLYLYDHTMNLKNCFLYQCYQQSMMLQC
jgi:hypothetical protein